MVIKIFYRKPLDFFLQGISYIMHGLLDGVCEKMEVSSWDTVLISKGYQNDNVLKYIKVDMGSETPRAISMASSDSWVVIFPSIKGLMAKVRLATTTMSRAMLSLNR